MEDNALPENEDVGLNTDETSQGASKWLPLGIGVFGIVLGITGILMANSASQEIADLESKLNAKSGESENLVKKVEELSTGLEQVGGSFLDLSKSIKSDKTENLRSFTKLGKLVSENRDQLNQFNKNLSDVGKVLADFDKRLKSPTVAIKKPAVASPKKEMASKKEEAEKVATVPAEGIHAIRPGDTLGKLSRIYGISLQEIIDLNPGIQPNRLQIGQKILIKK